MVVFGLGNPGPKYLGTRHNVGRETVERIAELKNASFKKKHLSKSNRAEIGNLRLVIPDTYMNLSGRAVIGNVRKGEEIVVIVDQVDLERGRIRIRKGGGSAGHNGLKSMISGCGPDFIRIYIGTGRPENGEPLEKYVLSRFSDDERPIINEAEKRAADAVLRLYAGESLESVARDINTK